MGLSAGRLDLDATQAERLWRAASGAAHGMYWTNLELTTIEVGEEYEPGHFRTFTLPDPDAMIEALQAGYRMAQYAALKYLDYSGADIESLYSPARRWLADNITFRPDVISVELS